MIEALLLQQERPQKCFDICIVYEFCFQANYIKERRFGGAMIFSLNADDFYGECGQQKFILTREVNYVLSR